MYARSAPSSRAGPAWERDSNGTQVLPENEETAPAAPIPQPAELQRQQSRYQQQQQQQHQHQLHEQNATQIPHSYQAPTTTTPLPAMSARLSPERTVERLAHRLSEQNLQRSPPSRDQPQTQPTPRLPTSSANVDTPELRDFQRWAESEVRGPSQHHARDASFYYHGYRNIPWLPISMPDVGEPIEVDEEYQDRPDDRRLLDVRRPRRQTSSQLRGASSTRPVDRRLEAMIASGTQCNVSESRPTATPPRPPPPDMTVIAQPPYIEPDPDCAMPTPDLEVDSAEGGGVLEFPSDLTDESIPLRYASGPGGIRKYTVGGIALRYRLSADAALRCANVVRSRPRMRKRHKTRHDNAGSSAVTSAVTSPAMSSAGSPPLPATRLPP